ncbi:MAG: TonB-dependent receptor [Xanthomarina gelatinilytica]|uniref:TonB-dependent receptor n=1 Tax=Xanthomarina gelatinilytica TaxID=1137281 RepID=UPI003A8B4278
MRLIIILILFSFTCFAQDNYTIKGTITHNNEILPFASVYLKNTIKGNTSNKEGKYLIDNVSPGNYEIIASYTGYNTSTKSITVTDKNITVNFNLESGESLNEITITGTLKAVSRLESAVPVEVYTPIFLKKNPTPNIFEALQNVNGVRPQLNCNVCNTGDIHINGLEGPYTLVLIDGMPIVSGLSTVYGLSGIPNSLIEQIEIVKGPASSLYGSEAVGGLINVITKLPENAPHFFAESFITGWGKLNVDTGFKTKVGEKASLLIGANYFNYSNPIDNIDTDEECRNPERIKVKVRWLFEALYATRSISNPLLWIANGNIIAKYCCITEMAKKADCHDVVNIRDKEGKSTWPQKNTEAFIDRVLAKMPWSSQQKEYFKGNPFIIARADDPFNENVIFDSNGQAIATLDNPYALTFDPSYVYGPNQGIRLFLGLRYTVFQ